MQKLLVVFVSVVTLMGLVAPSSADAIQERDGDRLARGLVPTPRGDGRYPQPSHHFKHKHHGQHEQRDVPDLVKRPQPSHHFNHKHHGQHEQRDPKPPQPSHRFKNKHHGHGDDDDQGHNHQERNSDRLARGLPPLPPVRRDSARHPRPSHHFKHKHHGHGDDDEGDNDSPTRRDNARHPRPSHHFKHKHHGHGDDDEGENDSPTRRDNARHPRPSHQFKHKHHGHGDDEDGNDSPTRRDNARHPRPSHQFKHKHHGHGDDDEGENDSPTRRDNARHPRPSHHFKHKHHGHGNDDEDENDAPTRRDSARQPHPSHNFKHKHHGHGDDDQGYKRQERNSDRLARGLPPLPPARRDSARHPQPSHHFKHKHQGNDDGANSRIEIRDTDGQSLGHLTDFTGSGQDFMVKYNPGAHTLSFHGDNLGDKHYLGASVSEADLSSNSPTFVYLTNVGIHDHQVNADIWSFDGNQLKATWKNSDGTTAPVRLCLNSAGNTIVLAGSPPPGYKEVYFYLN